MKVFDLICITGHRFEGWFMTSAQFAEQCEASTVRCPLCDSSEVHREPSAPRLNLGNPLQPANARADSHPTTTADGQVAMASMVDGLRRMIAATENVGPRFAEEARRIHYQEIAAKPIRGTATDRERQELLDEGIETLRIPLLPALTETLQ